jgi:hypothetical protein
MYGECYLEDIATKTFEILLGLMPGQRFKLTICTTTKRNEETLIWNFVIRGFLCSAEDRN